MAEADAKVPQIASLLRAIWHDVTPGMLIRQADGTMTSHPIVDGLAQGGCDSQPAFCLGIGRAIRMWQCQCQEEGIAVHAWAYVDDVVLQVSPKHTERAIELLDKAFSTVGLERRPDKCRWFVPATAAAAAYPEWIGSPAKGGLPILGSVADGAYRTIASPTDLTSPDA